MTPSKSLLLTTIELWGNRPRTHTIEYVAQQTGLPETWIRDFSANGSLRDSSVNRVQILYEFLSGRSLL